MKKFISTLFLVILLVFGQAANAADFCEIHPKICRAVQVVKTKTKEKAKAVWRGTKKICAETLVVVQWTGAVITIIILLPAVIL